jgi:hypothetical protein
MNLLLIPISTLIPNIYFPRPWGYFPSLRLTGPLNHILNYPNNSNVSIGRRNLYQQYLYRQEYCGGIWEKLAIEFLRHHHF